MSLRTSGQSVQLGIILSNSFKTCFVQLPEDQCWGGVQQLHLSPGGAGDLPLVEHGGGNAGSKHHVLWAEEGGVG